MKRLVLLCLFVAGCGHKPAPKPLYTLNAFRCGSSRVTQGLTLPCTAFLGHEVWADLQSGDIIYFAGARP